HRLTRCSGDCSTEVSFSDLRDSQSIAFFNNSIPGVFKNAIDWLSRPSSDIKRVFGGRHFAIMGASPGGFGTTLSQAAWLPVMRTLGTQTWFGGRLLVARAAGVFDEGGSLKDATVEEQLKQFLAGYVT